jgi:hypothetical protein
LDGRLGIGSAPSIEKAGRSCFDQPDAHLYGSVLTNSVNGKAAVRRIDGVRTIVDIVEGMPSVSRETTNFDVARNLLERLWWHDQVVFYLSQQPGVFRERESLKWS